MLLSSDRVTVTTALFNGGDRVPERSRVYSPSWVDKLYRGVKRNTTRDFDFVVLTHYPQEAFEEPVRAVPFTEDTRQVMCLTEVFRPDLEIQHGFFIALDTVIVGDIDDFMDYRGEMAMPVKDFGGNVPTPYNAICLYRGKDAQGLWEERAKANQARFRMDDFGASEQMYWASYPRIENIYGLFPGQLACCEWLHDGKPSRGEARPAEPDVAREQARIVYFFGENKPSSPRRALAPLVAEHWI